MKFFSKAFQDHHGFDASGSSFDSLVQVESACSQVLNIFTNCNFCEKGAVLESENEVRLQLDKLQSEKSFIEVFDNGVCCCCAVTFTCTNKQELQHSN
mmetsp:Transcript_11436/g.17146  ORF Transcript_11436/g.17146 Transcript_11436/m.17146 type:complete len:98 (+) Transcript_11436:1532-1825(+)